MPGTDPETGKTSARTVAAVWRHSDTVLELVTGDGATVATTEDHPFWNATDHAWQQAQQLDPGDQLYTVNTRPLRVAGLNLATARTATAYNLTIREVRTYYVFVGATPVLVHNTCADEISWSGAHVGAAAKALDTGATSVVLRSRSEAEELFFRKYQGAGYVNASGFDGKGTRQYFGEKRGTYHWDDKLDPEGRVAGHGSGNRHGDLPHLQIHTFDGPVIRIFWRGA